MSKFDCQHVQALMPEWVDGDLSSQQAAHVRSHLEICGECSARFSIFRKADTAVIGWGEAAGRAVLPPFGARERLASHLVPGRAWNWAPFALAMAAVVFLVVLVPREVSVPPGHVESGFIDVPYLAPLGPNENTTIVRMDVEVATLLAAGYRVNADPSVTVPVDVLVGEDGRAHAVRVLADIDVNGTGD